MENADKRFVRRCSKVLKCMEIKGNICEDCKKDLSDTPWDAEFHHIDPKIKDHSISQIVNDHLSNVIKELDKCILLCCGCHRGRHFNIKRYKKYRNIIKQRILEIDLYKNKKIDKDRVYNLIKKKKSIVEIALLLNAKERSIRRVLRCLEKEKKERLIQTKKEYINSRIKITDEELLNCYSKNIKRKDIKKQFNISDGVLSKRIKRLKEQGLITTKWPRDNSTNISGAHLERKLIA
jgi:hypothetical protein